MARHALLNNVAHKNLKVITRFGAQFGDNIGTVLAFPTEFGDIQREYPIFFRKDPQTNEYMAVALLGLQKDENLFLEGDRWDASYIPGIVAKGPFLIGFQERSEAGEMKREPMIHVDLDSPRVSETEGEPVFLEMGGNSRYLEQVATILGGINDGIAAMKDMAALLTKHDLIEPVNLEIKLDAQERYDVVGLHTISDEKLRNLGPEAVFELHRSGFLGAAHLVMSSLNNVRRLIDRKRRRKVQAASAS
jgi:hypothetical protein